jgi:transcriptional regulator with XRE-family HTH domain
MFKENFIRLCNERGEYPSAVCKKVGITPAAFSQWTEDTVPRKTTLVKVADYFGVSTDYLLGTEHEFLQTFAQEKDPPKISESEEKLLALFREVPEADQEMVLMMIQSALSLRKSAKATEEIASNITRTAASIQRPRTFGMYRGRAGAGIPVRGMKVYRGKSNETEAAEIIARRKKVSK